MNLKISSLCRQLALGAALTASLLSLTPRAVAQSFPNSPPNVWNCYDIGSFNWPGGQAYNESNSEMQISSGGSGVSGTSDTLHFACQPLYGNGSIVTQVTSLTDSAAGAECGLMIRQSSAANAQFAMVGITAGQGACFQYRTSQGGLSSTGGTSGSSTAPVYLKLTRSGNTFTGYTSTNGTSWTQVGQETVSMTSNTYAGFAVWSATSSNYTVADLANTVFMPTEARSAFSFDDSIGVNVHLTYTDTAYGNFAGVVQPYLTQLGVKHFRDAYNASTASDFETLASSGIKSIEMLADPSDVPDLSQTPNDVLGSIEMVEGPNETDDNGDSWTYDGESFPYGTTAFQNALYTNVTTSSNSTIKALPVIATSVGNPSDESQLAPLTSCNYENMHSYPSGGLPDNALDATWIPDANEIVGAGNPTKSVIATETGYFTDTSLTDGIDEATQAKYVPRLVAEYMNRFVTRTYFYELIDEISTWNTGLNGTTSESHYGLVRDSSTVAQANAGDRQIAAKPAYTALQSMISILSDSGNFSTGTLNYSLTGQMYDVHQLLLEKANGDYYLLVWRDVSCYNPSTQTDINNGYVNVTLTLPSTFATINLYEPSSTGTSVAWTTSNVSSLGIGVLDQLMIFELVP